MRRVLMMVFAIAVFMSLGTTGVLAQGKAPKTCKGGEVYEHGKCVPKPKKCKKGEVLKHGKCVPKPVRCAAGEEKVNGKCVPKPVRCADGEEKVNGKCVPKPVKCADGEEKVNGKCVPRCRDDEYRDKDGKCQPKPPVCKDDQINVDGKCKPRPKDGPCAKADLVLLEDLLKGTGALLCVYLGDNAPHASNGPGGDCPDALLALPVDNLIGACLFLPPADVGNSKTSGISSPLPAGNEAAADTTAAGLGSTLMGLLGLG